MSRGEKAIPLIRHRNYVRAEQEFKLCLESPGWSPIIIIGVGGVGKTTVRHLVLRSLYGNPKKWGVGRLPVIETIALLPTQSFFSSNGLAQDSYQQLYVPDLRWLYEEGSEPPEDAKAIIDQVEKSRRLWEGVAPRKLSSEIRTWSQFRDTATTRQLKVYSIEHASALCVNHKNQTPTQHILNLMSLSEAVQAKAVLTTIQTGYELWQGRSEIRRRMDVIWVAPYDVANKDDMLCFLRLLKSICQYFAFVRTDLPFTMAPEIAAATGGICGEIVKLFQRALRRANRDGRDKIKKSDIEESYYREKDMQTLWKDIMEFREASRNDPSGSISRMAKENWYREQSSKK